MPTRTPNPSTRHAASTSRAYDADVLDDAEPGADRSLGIVLVGHGRTEEGEDAVAGEVLDRAAERFDRVDHPRDRVGDHELELLGIEPLPERGGPHEVGEQRRDDPAFFARVAWRAAHPRILPYFRSGAHQGAGRR